MVDFDFYLGTYKGNIIPDPLSFDRAVIEASAYVDRFIINRDNLEYPVIEQKYKFAICAVADVIYTQSNQDKSKLSESVGNHSVSYNIQKPEELEKEKRSKVLTYLSGTGLLYGGMH